MRDLLSGLAADPSFRATLQVFGQRAPGWVVDASAVPTEAHSDGLTYFPINGVFGDQPATFLGFGKPNTYLVVPRGQHDIADDRHDLWYKFAAFMAYRGKSARVRTKKRAQAGIQVEFVDLPEEANAELRLAMSRLAGRRTPSCAHANAQVLAAANFTLGNDEPLTQAYRPSKLFSLIWRHGLKWSGTPVTLRFIQTSSKPVYEFFMSVWAKELLTACRLVQKTFGRSAAHTPAPTFDLPTPPLTMALSDSGNDPMLVSVSRPSWLAAHLGAVFGHYPIYTIDLGEGVDDPAFATTLESYPGKLDRYTKAKKYVLFSPPVVKTIRRHLASNSVSFSVPRHALLNMMQVSPGPEYETAFVYNLVVLSLRDRVTIVLIPLKRLGVTRPTKLEWMVTKHLVGSGYQDCVVFAGEVWRYQQDGETTLALTRNSGTYKPDQLRHMAAATAAETVFGVHVNTVI